MNLSELISECKGYIHSIYKNSDDREGKEWWADWNHWTFSGKTPEEAVTNLLNKLKIQGFI